MSKKINLIIRYPVKSFSGESLNQADITDTGIAFDRHWMLVNEVGGFLTQRKQHNMALLRAEICDNQLKITLANGDVFMCEINAGRNNDEIQNKNTTQVSIWNDKVKATIIDHKINKVLSEYLKMTVRLVAINENHPRIISDAAADGIVSFADAFPFLLIGTKSLEKLNTKLALHQQVSMKNFRPNLVVETDIAHEEDDWREIKIGDVHFKNVKLCSRCILTTIDPSSGNRSIDQEPLKTLSKYRLIDQKIMFGCNLIALNKGVVRLGDKVEIIN